MRVPVPALALLVAASLSASAARAEDDKVKLSVLAFNLAIDKARKDSDACKQGVMGPLKDARDGIQSGAVDAAKLTRARRAVEDLVDGPASQCGEPVQKELQRALDRLQEAITERGGTSAPPQAASGGAASTGTGANPDLEQAKKCWNYVNPWTRVDPGCAHTRAGNPPYDKAKFEKLRGQIQSAGDRFAKTAIVERLVGETKIFLTCLQLSALLGMYGEEPDRLETLKRLAGTLVDPHNSSVLAKHFRDVQARKDALQTIDENKETK